jgi:hypothetical protein
VGVAYLTLGGRTGQAPAPHASSRAPQQATAPATAPPENPVEAPPPEPAALAPRSRLQVTAMRPTHRTFNYRDTPIEVDFSLPIRQETVPAAFKVQPPMPGTFAWPAPNKLVFTPQGLWDHGANYLVTLEEGITDVNGVDRLETTSWDFSTVGGYFYSRDIRPVVKAHCALCHRAEGPAARVRLDTLGEIRRFVQPGDAGKSRFITALTDPNHQGKLPPEALAKGYLLRDWITVFKAGD